MKLKLVEETEEKMEIDITPIGVVKNGIKAKPEKWEEIESEIHVKKEFQEGLEGLDEFSHVMVVFYLHLSSSVLLKIHPRGRENLPIVGVFSTRAPLRPNHIGVSVVELMRVDGNIVVVKGLDAFDGTPVLDLKPHLWADNPTKVAEWVHQ